MDARQRVQLTGTNRSFDLIALINQCPGPGTDGGASGNRQAAVPSPLARPGKTSRRRPEGRAGDEPRPSPARGASVPRHRSSPAWWLSARRSDPIPSRTRPSNASAPMVLCLKTWESRSPPGPQRSDQRTAGGGPRATNRHPRRNAAPASNPPSSRRRGTNTGRRRTIRAVPDVQPPSSDRRGVEQPGSSSGS